MILKQASRLCVALAVAGGTVLGGHLSFADQTGADGSAAGASAPATAGAANTDAGLPVPPTARVRRPRSALNDGAGTIEERLQYFTKKLDLDPVQQAKLRKILIDQRAAVQRIWSDASLMPTERVPATIAANDRVGDEIRAILNDAQREKYNPPKPAAPHTPGDKRTVEDWMNSTRTQ